MDTLNTSPQSLVLTKSNGTIPDSYSRADTTNYSTNVNSGLNKNVDNMPVFTPNSNSSTWLPSVITPEAATTDVNKIISNVGDVNNQVKSQAENVANNKAQNDLKNNQSQQYYDQNPLFKRPNETDDQYNTRIEQGKASGLIPTTKADLIKGVTGDTTTPTPDTTSEFTKSVQAISDATEKAYTEYQNNLNNLRNGTFPLTSAEQGQIDATNAKIDQLKQSQLLANKNYENAITLSGISSGRNRYAPEVQAGNLAGAINAGIQKISDIEAQRSAELATLQKAIDDKNYAMIKDSYDAFEKLASDKSKAITDIYNATIAHEKDVKADIAQKEKDVYDRITKPIQDIGLEAAKNGAPQSLLDKIKFAQSPDEAISAAGNYLSTATGQLGDYYQYVRQTEQAGGKPESYQMYKEADDERKANIEIAKSVAIENAKASGAGLNKSDVTNLFNTLGSYQEKQYITPTDLDGYTAAEKSAIINAAKQVGIKTLSPKDADVMSTISTAKDDIQQFSSFINKNNILPTNFWGQPKQYMDVKLNEYLQTNNELQAFNTWKLSVLPIMAALKGAGSGGGGGAARLFNTIGDLLPESTDTLPTAQSKINIINTLLNNGAKEIIGSSPIEQAHDSAVSSVAAFIQASPQNKEKYDQLKKIMPDASPVEIAQQLGLQ